MVIHKDYLEEKTKEHGTAVIETDHSAKYNAFRELVCTKLVKFWGNPDQIKLAIHETLADFSRREELVGWVRGDQVIDLADDAEMALIPAGEFKMGSAAGDDDEMPVHTVSLDAFYIDKHPVTNAQFKQFVTANPEWSKNGISRKYHGGDYLKDWNGNNYPNTKNDHPVTQVSWYAAMA